MNPGSPKHHGVDRSPSTGGDLPTPNSPQMGCTCLHWRLKGLRGLLNRRLYYTTNTIQYNTIQYNTIQLQYNTIQYNTIQYNTIQYYTILYTIYCILYTKYYILYTILIPYHIMLYYTILYYTILYYTILYYTILYYTILYYTRLDYTILDYPIVLFEIIPFYLQQTAPIKPMRSKPYPEAPSQLQAETLRNLAQHGRILLKLFNLAVGVRSVVLLIIQSLHDPMYFNIC